VICLEHGLPGHGGPIPYSKPIVLPIHVRFGFFSLSASVNNSQLPSRSTQTECLSEVGRTELKSVPPIRLVRPLVISRHAPAQFLSISYLKQSARERRFVDPSRRGLRNGLVHPPFDFPCPLGHWQSPQFPTVCGANEMPALQGDGGHGVPRGTQALQ
jgi:hypothetical protein